MFWARVGVSGVASVLFLVRLLRSRVGARWIKIRIMNRAKAAIEVNIRVGRTLTDANHGSTKIHSAIQGTGTATAKIVTMTAMVISAPAAIEMKGDRNSWMIKTSALPAKLQSERRGVGVGVKPRK